MANNYEMQIETILSKRIRKWEESLSNVLNEEQNRVKFDIKEYAHRVLNSCEKKSNNRTNAIPFTEITKKVEHFEKCRMFLATLHLANEYHVDIENNNGNMFIKIN